MSQISFLFGTKASNSQIVPEKRTKDSKSFDFIYFSWTLKKSIISLNLFFYGSIARFPQRLLTWKIFISRNYCFVLNHFGNGTWGIRKNINLPIRIFLTFFLNFFNVFRLFLRIKKITVKISKCHCVLANFFFQKNWQKWCVLTKKSMSWINSCVIWKFSVKNPKKN